MCTLKSLIAGALATALGSMAMAADTPKLGRPITEQDIAAWDIAAMPSGAGLPAGSGNAGRHRYSGLRE